MGCTQSNSACVKHDSDEKPGPGAVGTHAIDGLALKWVVEAAQQQLLQKQLAPSESSAASLGTVPTRDSSRSAVVAVQKAPRSPVEQAPCMGPRPPNKKQTQAQTQAQALRFYIKHKSGVELNNWCASRDGGISLPPPLN